MAIGFFGVLFFSYLTIQSLLLCTAGETSRYVRKTQQSIDLPMDSPFFARPPGYNAPEQVHITQGDQLGRAVTVSWVTPSEAGNSVVYYGTSQGNYTREAKGNSNKYTYYNYTSGYIHHVVVDNLEYSTVYYYKLGEGNASRAFWFETPPKVDPDTPYLFGLIGDLGQTYDSLSTLQHYMSSEAKAVLFVGDLSYADHYPDDDGNRWDSWGRLVEQSTAYQPWIWTTGNHEIEFHPEIGESKPFKPFDNRFKTPFRHAQSTSNHWYSIKRASAHIIILSAYDSFVMYTPQWHWLQAEFTRVNRTITPWLIILVHSPWYNSNTYHFMEGEAMRVQFEPWVVKYNVDIIFAGHVHAYERSHKISNVRYAVSNKLCTPVLNPTAPVYVTIGDGGNIEGLASNFSDPQPNYSAYREASFGHGLLDIKNKTHAYFSWHRNQDGEPVIADSIWLHNNFWASTDSSQWS